MLQECVKPSTAIPFQHTCQKEIKRTTSNSGEYKCQATYEVLYQFISKEERYFKVVAIEAPVGTVYFFDNMKRTLTAKYFTSDFPDESHFNIET